MGTKKWPKTNLQVLGSTKARPVIGDLFLANMLGKHWILGRVVDDCCHMFSGKDEVLLYFYKHKYDESESIKVPISPDLLIPPIIISSMAWKMGIFRTLRNVPIVAEEKLSQHYFMKNSPPVDPAAADAVFVDQMNRRIRKVPSKDEYWDFSGLSNVRELDSKLSEALGYEPLKDDY